MVNRSLFIYWDSNVFLHLIEGTSAYIDGLRSAIAQYRATNTKILTSTIAKTEGAFASTERQRGMLDPAIEARIDAMWDDYTIVAFVEVTDTIAVNARSLMRRGLQRKYAIKPFDAIHLASAEWSQAAEIHTYEPKWLSYG